MGEGVGAMLTSFLDFVNFLKSAIFCFNNEINTSLYFTWRNWRYFSPILVFKTAVVIENLG